MILIPVGFILSAARWLIVAVVTGTIYWFAELADSFSRTYKHPTFRNVSRFSLRAATTVIAPILVFNIQGFGAALDKIAAQIGALGNGTGSKIVEWLSIATGWAVVIGGAGIVVAVPYIVYRVDRNSWKMTLAIMSIFFYFPAIYWFLRSFLHLF
jgi:hypothetical protein